MCEGIRVAQASYCDPRAARARRHAHAYYTRLHAHVCMLVLVLVVFGWRLGPRVGFWLWFACVIVESVAAFGLVAWSCPRVFCLAGPWASPTPTNKCRITTGSRCLRSERQQEAPDIEMRKLYRASVYVSDCVSMVPCCGPRLPLCLPPCVSACMRNCARVYLPKPV